MTSLLLILSQLSHFKIAALTSYLLLQGFVVTIFPEEVVITTLGFLWNQGRISFFEAWMAVSIGLLPANFFTFLIGRRFGFKALSYKPFCWFFKRESIHRSLVSISQYQAWVVFFTRFIPIIRGPIYFSAGLSQMTPLNFFKTDFLASCIEIPMLLLLGKTIGQRVTHFVEALQWMGVGVAILLVSFFIVKPLLKKTFF